jgi:hypothetical protein
VVAAHTQLTDLIQFSAILLLLVVALVGLDLPKPLAALLVDLVVVVALNLQQLERQADFLAAQGTPLR